MIAITGPFKMYATTTDATATVVKYIGSPQIAATKDEKRWLHAISNARKAKP